MSKQRLPIDSYFQLQPTDTDVTYRSSYINKQLREMDKKELSNTILNFDLEPVHRYLKIQENVTDIEGYILYVDAYLLEQSGGDRVKLSELAKELLGMELPCSTSRLMRLQIIADYLRTSNN